MPKIVKCLPKRRNFEYLATLITVLDTSYIQNRKMTTTKTHVLTIPERSIGKQSVVRTSEWLNDFKLKLSFQSGNTNCRRRKMDDTSNSFLHIFCDEAILQYFAFSLTGSAFNSATGGGRQTLEHNRSLVRNINYYEPMSYTNFRVAWQPYAEIKHPDWLLQVT